MVCGCGVETKCKGRSKYEYARSLYYCSRPSIFLGPTIPSRSIRSAPCLFFYVFTLRKESGVRHLFQTQSLAFSRFLHVPFVIVLQFGKTPILPPAELGKMGYTMVGYPLSLLSSSIKAIKSALGRLKAEEPLDDILGSFDEVKRVVSFQDNVEPAPRYDTNYTAKRPNGRLSAVVYRRPRPSIVGDDRLSAVTAVYL